MQFDEIKWQSTNTQRFVAELTVLEVKQKSIENNWARYIDIHPMNTSGTWSLYYLVGSKLETVLADQSVFTRLFLPGFFRSASAAWSCSLPT